MDICVEILILLTGLCVVPRDHQHQLRDRTAALDFELPTLYPPARFPPLRHQQSRPCVLKCVRRARGDVPRAESPNPPHRGIA